MGKNVREICVFIKFKNSIVYRFQILDNDDIFSLFCVYHGFILYVTGDITYISIFSNFQHGGPMFCDLETIITQTKFVRTKRSRRA